MELGKGVPRSNTRDLKRVESSRCQRLIRPKSELDDEKAKLQKSDCEGEITSKHFGTNDRKCE